MIIVSARIRLGKDHVEVWVISEGAVDMTQDRFNVAALN